MNKVLTEIENKICYLLDRFADLFKPTYLDNGFLDINKQERFEAMLKYIPKVIKSCNKEQLEVWEKYYNDTFKNIFSSRNNEKIKNDLKYIDSEFIKRKRDLELIEKGVLC